jgi:hypothetical protein
MLSSEQACNLAFAGEVQSLFSSAQIEIYYFFLRNGSHIKKQYVTLTNVNIIKQVIFI